MEHFVVWQLLLFRISGFTIRDMLIDFTTSLAIGFALKLAWNFRILS